MYQTNTSHVVVDVFRLNIRLTLGRKALCRFATEGWFLVQLLSGTIREELVNAIHKLSCLAYFEDGF